MKPIEIFSAVVIHGPAALAWPHVSRALLLAGRFFRDDDTRGIARALLLHSGDWRAAVAWLRSGPRGVPVCRVQSFARWAESLTPKRQPLLIGWKGGAS